MSTQRKKLRTTLLNNEYFLNYVYVLFLQSPQPPIACYYPRVSELGQITFMIRTRRFPQLCSRPILKPKFYHFRIRIWKNVKHETCRTLRDLSRDIKIAQNGLRMSEIWPKYENVAVQSILRI